MTIGDLQDYFENTENPKFYLVDVFSWRGRYDEVAFTPSKHGNKKESLGLIEKALSETFLGWKGGDYTYADYTQTHFETEQSSFSDTALYKLLLND